jgi:hypothetical protein
MLLYVKYVIEKLFDSLYSTLNIRPHWIFVFTLMSKTVNVIHWHMAEFGFKLLLKYEKNIECDLEEKLSLMP